jgi:predicted RND superfamily exporter protein
LPRRLVRASVQHPRRTFAVWAAILVVAAIGVARLRVDTTTDSVLDRGAEPWSYYQSSQERFGGDEIAVVALTGSAPFDAAVLREVRRLSRAYAQLPGVRRVDSLASVPLIRATPDGTLVLDGAIEAGVPDTPEGLRRLAAEVAADRIAPRNLVSEDGRVFALNVVLAQDFDGDYDGLVAAIRAELPSTGARMSGVPVFRSAANARTRGEILLFVPLTVLAIAALLVAVFRQLRAAAIGVAVGVIGSFVMAGAMGLAGVSISLVTMILPSVILALGCSYVMRVLSPASEVGDRGDLLGALLPIALPVALSGLTTAIGFAVAGVVRIEEVRNVGAFGAAGVLALTAASLTIAPAAVAMWPLPAGRARGSEWAAGPLRRLLLDLAARRRGPVGGAWLALLVVFSVGLVRLDVETDATRWFPPGTEVRDSYEAIREDLSGISPINVVLESRDGIPVTDPAVLRAIDGLSAHLESLPDVGKVVSIADPLRQIHGGFTGDSTLPLPNSTPLIEQYLLLLESTEEIRDLVTADRSAANVVLRANNNGSGPLLAIGEEARRWWSAHGVAGVAPRGTGIMYEFARAEDEIALGQIRGLGLGLVAIGVILLAALRNAQLSAVALVPNVVPIAMVYGFMGLAGVALDAGTVIVGSLALGIAVDDTIHLISAFQEEREREGAALPALDSALARILHPVVFTTLAVAIGFGLLGFSQFTFTRNLGLLVAGTMVVCLLADLVLLPSLLARLQPSSSPGRN